MKFVVDDCVDEVLGDTQLSGNVILRYSSVCHDDVMDFGNGVLCGDGDWPSRSLPDSPCHVCIHQPTSSPCCMKGHSPLV